MQGKNIEKILRKNKPARKTDKTRRDRKAVRANKQINLLEKPNETIN